MQGEVSLSLSPVDFDVLILSFGGGYVIAFVMGLLLDLRVRRGMGMMRIRKVCTYFLLPRLVQLGV